ncbi:MAG: hypothetical protein KC464_28700 [Myxococcales bacterium]|nr:hypothetical protein [Myxococcales bacterium]
MSDAKPIVCGRHGTTPRTYMCQHLACGVACGYHASDEAPADPWPDAWCDLCDATMDAAGGWTDEVSAVARIEVLCARCYERARDRNQRVPPRARGAGVRLDARAIDAFVRDAVHEAQRRQELMDQRWQLGELARWDFDDEAAMLTFTDPRLPPLVVDVLLVGSYSTRSGTFQWAWKTREGADDAALEVAQLRTFGEVRGIPALTVANRACDEVEAWELAAIAAHVLGADGLYRAPFDHLYWFMLLRNPRRPNQA